MRQSRNRLRGPSTGYETFPLEGAGAVDGSALAHVVRTGPALSVVGVQGAGFRVQGSRAAKELRPHRVSQKKLTPPTLNLVPTMPYREVHGC